MKQLWAHSANGSGDRHLLEDHLRGTAERARGFGEIFGAGDLAAYLGMVHDVGKGACGWQQRLLVAERDRSRVGTDHKLAGTWLASKAAGQFALCVHGHHGGLVSRAELQKVLNSALEEMRKGWNETAGLVAAVCPEVIRSLPENLVPSWLAEKSAGPAAPDLFARLLFSTLVDADFLDTEAHFSGSPRPGSGLGIGDLADRYETRRLALLAEREPSPADEWRAEVYAQAVAAAAGPPGIYRMAAPTGSGKTIAMGGFAVRHARAHGLRRVILAVPFISITEQNADVYRCLLDEDSRSVVLEHHSGTDLDGEGGVRAWWAKLAAENWDAPFVVTTTVQLFQSLFDHRPSAMRKLHRLAGSLIVLDEVQALPDRLLMPILSSLRLLTERFGTTVLLASATQPSYSVLKPFRGIEPREVIADRAPLYGKFRRVRYEWQLDPAPSLADIAGQVAAERQVLAVVNTTADSAALHRLVRDRSDDPFWKILHLSTRMAAQHRREVLEEIRRLLAAGEPVAVISTQLIEAGVDVDFPVVFRAWAPADSLQQAAGRANRNARLGEGRVVVFGPSDGGQPSGQSYRQALGAAETHFGPGRADPDDLGALDGYYRERYSRQDLERSGVGAEIEKLRRDMDFPAVAAKFQMIEDHTVSVAVPYPGEGDARERLDEIIAQLRAAGPKVAGEARRLLRDLGPYLATIPKKLARTAVSRGYAEPVIGDLLEWKGPYDDERGIDPADVSDLMGVAEVTIW